MLGRKLVQRLSRDGVLAGKAIAHAHLVDIIAPEAPTDAPFVCACQGADLAAPYWAKKLIATQPDAIFLLASVVSGEAESDFDKGYAINLDGARGIFEAIRAESLRSNGAYRPRLIFTSSIAVFGAPTPDIIDDEFLAAPLTSYGAQKAICELLLSDYSRCGFLDAIALRLPTICVRPGAPNKAASGFFSNIIREPLAGRKAVLPVAETVRHYHASPRSAVRFLLHAAALDLAQLGARRALTLPGVSVTVGEQIDALRRIAGPDAVKLIARVPDAAIAKIVAGWPRNFAAARARALGFVCEANFDAIIQSHIEDEHVGQLA